MLRLCSCAYKVTPQSPPRSVASVPTFTKEKNEPKIMEEIQEGKKNKGN